VNPKKEERFMKSIAVVLLLLAAPSLAQAQSQTNIVVNPAPVYMLPPPPPPRPPSGLKHLVTGLVLLPLAVIVGGSSIPVWQAHHCDLCRPAAIVMDASAGLFTLAAAVEIPIGAVRYAHYRRWPEAQLHPFASAGPQGGAVGLRGRF
jgi:hypothetical protein